MRVEKIIKKFGGLAKMARKTGLPKTTISSWKINKNIPYWRHEFLEQKALEESFSVKKYLTEEPEKEKTNER